MATLVVKQVKSSINKTKRQKATLEALGLRKLNHVVEHQDTPAIKGMLDKVSHLVEIQEK